MARLKPGLYFYKDVESYTKATRRKPKPPYGVTFYIRKIFNGEAICQSGYCKEKIHITGEDVFTVSASKNPNRYTLRRYERKVKASVGKKHVKVDGIFFQCPKCNRRTCMEYDERFLNILFKKIGVYLRKEHGFKGRFHDH